MNALKYFKRLLKHPLHTALFIYQAATGYILNSLLYATVMR
jgi:hypothetical protein